MKNLVSIIVPCYNQGKYLDECLQSVTNQTYSNWECIIIDDGSTDDSEVVGRKWSDKDLRFHYFKQENGGVSAARNLGVKKCKGTYILPLDADDYISNNYIEVCASELDKNLSLKLVYGEAYKFGEENLKWDLPTYSFDRLLQYNMIFCTAMYKKSDFEEVGGYDQNMKESAEDWDFWIGLLKSGGDVLKTDKCQFYYRIKINSRNSNIVHNQEKINISYNYLFNKHIDSYHIGNGIELYNSYIHEKKQKEIFEKRLNHVGLDTLFKEGITILKKRIKCYLNIK